MSIKRATFSAPFLRADPLSVSRDSISSFHSFLDEAVSKGTNASIQKCKSWLVENATSSGARVTALGKYLTSLTTDEPASNIQKIAKKGISVRKKRLYLLYLINDLLHHTKYHGQHSGHYENLRTQLEPHLVELVDSAASFEASKNKKLHRKLRDLVAVWETNDYYGKDFCSKLRETLETSGKLAGDSQQKPQDNGPALNGKHHSKDKTVPATLPAIHGDRTGHWSDLLAGCMVPLITRNSKRPIRVRELKPFETNSRSAHPAMIEAVKDLFKEADHIYMPYRQHKTGTVANIDQMGQPYYREKETGELKSGDTYYGWSRKFAESMRKRQRDTTQDRGDIRNARNRSRSRSFSPHKRPRHDSYSDRSYTRSRTPSWTQSRRSYTRSPSRSQARPSFEGPRRSFTGSPSRIQSYHGDRRGSYTGSPSHSRPYYDERRHSYTRSPSHSRSYHNDHRSPRSSSPRHSSRPPSRHDNRGYGPGEQAFGTLIGTFPMGRPGRGQGVGFPSISPAGVAIPPRPPNWTGPWPPPPPPPPPPQAFQQGPGPGPGPGPNGYGGSWGGMPMPFPGGGRGRGRQGWGRDGWRG